MEYLPPGVGYISVAHSPRNFINIVRFWWFSNVFHFPLNGKLLQTLQSNSKYSEIRQLKELLNKNSPENY